jgi:hypothetical protein
MKIYDDLSREELYSMIRDLKRDLSIKHSKQLTAIAEVRHFRNRLLKVRNDIQYLLEHPWSRNATTRQKFQEKKLKEYGGQNG